MKAIKPLPVPQKEFGFTADTFNLLQEWTQDGERIARERARSEQERERAEAAQTSLLLTGKKSSHRCPPVG